MKRRNPYSVRKVKELVKKFTTLLEEIRVEGKYTFPEIIVAFHTAIHIQIMKKVKE